MIPSPRPMIKRSLISNAVVDIEQISQAAKIPRRRYNDLYDWLLKHRFYLLPDDCERVNLAVQEIERRLQEEFPSAIWAIRHKFEPDPEMGST